MAVILGHVRLLLDLLLWLVKCSKAISSTSSISLAQILAIAIHWWDTKHRRDALTRHPIDEFSNKFAILRICIKSKRDIEYIFRDSRYSNMHSGDRHNVCQAFQKQRDSIKWPPYPPT